MCVHVECDSISIHSEFICWRLSGNYSKCEEKCIDSFKILNICSVHLNRLNFGLFCCIFFVNNMHMSVLHCIHHISISILAYASEAQFGESIKNCVCECMTYTQVSSEEKNIHQNNESNQQLLYFLLSTFNKYDDTVNITNRFINCELKWTQKTSELPNNLISQHKIARQFDSKQETSIHFGVWSAFMNLCLPSLECYSGKQ